NGQTTVDGDFPAMPDEGIIAWQIHSGPPMEATFRNILFRGLSDGWVSLFNGRDLTGFKTILQNGKEDDGQVFSVKEGAIVVSGSPNGYFYTDNSYKNYVIKFDWKFIKDGNSGCLVHITGKHQVWPKCIEVQGQQQDHGNIFAVGGAKGTFQKDADAQKK